MVDKLMLPFHLLADPDASAIAAYGVYHEKEQRARPAAFVIGRDLSIAYRYVGRDFADRPLTDELIAALDRIEDAPAKPLPRGAVPAGPRAPTDTGRTPFPLEHLPPYMRGVNFALEAIGGRIAEDEQLRTEIATYRSIAQDYLTHSLATLKLRG
jgi:AhpC/TSA family protein